MLFTHEHTMLRELIATFVEREINPYVDEWEDEGIFPAHELFKKWVMRVFWGSIVMNNGEAWG